MEDYSYLTKLTDDWKITSYGDFGAFAGVGARCSHQKFYSAKLKKGVNTIFLEVGVGGGASAGIPEIDKIIAQINNLVKVKDARAAESSYKALTCHRAFSIVDIVGALGDCESGQLVLGDGPKYVRIAARGNGFGPAGSALLFTLPVTFLGEKTYGVAAEASVTSGVFLGVGTQFYNYNMQQRFQREKGRTPSSPVIMDLAK
jgi:hypothetical protein